MSEKDLIKKIEDMNLLISKEINNREELIKQKKNELETKDKSINDCNSANKKFISELENLKKSVDNQLGNYNIKDAYNQIKKITKHENTPDQILKIREKEIKNMNKIIKFLQDENKSLSNKDDLNNFKKVNELSDKLDQLTKDNYDLENRIRLVNRNFEEGNKLAIIQERQFKNKGIFENEARDLKNRLAKIEENSKMRKKNIILADIEEKRLNTDVEAYRRKLPNVKVKTYDEILKSKNMIKTSCSPKNKKNIINFDSKALVSKSIDDINRLKFMFKTPNEYLNYKPKLFSELELDILGQKVDIQKLKNYSKMFDDVLNEKESINKHYEEEIGKLNIEFDKESKNFDNTINLVKENDRKNNLLKHQLNEVEYESKVLNKRLSEIRKTRERLEKVYLEKVFNQQLLKNQTDELKIKQEQTLTKAKEEKEKERLKKIQQDEEDEENEENEEELNNDSDDA